MADGGRSPMTPFTPGPDTARQFRDALGQFTTGVTVVTCRHEGAPLGITANSFASVSLDPPLVLWSPARSSRRFAAFEAAQHFAIHILAEDQRGVCNGFVQNGAAFDALDWTENAQGVPLIEGCLARFDCTRHAVYEGGDHAIIVGLVTAAALGAGDPLLFAKGAYGRFTVSG